MKTWIFSALLLTSLAANAKLQNLDQALQAVQQKQAWEAKNINSPANQSRLYYHGNKTAKAVLVIHGIFGSPKYSPELIGALS